MGILGIFDFIIFPIIIVASMALVMSKKHPKGLYPLFFTEMWERFGFYTMLSILALYMDEHFKMPKAFSGQVYGLFYGFIYFTPLLGGFLADRVFGFVKTIAFGAVLLAIGYGILGINNLNIFYIALAIIILGNGLFKPNISALVGNLYDDNDPNKDAGFNIFYMGINIGAFYAPSAANFLRKTYGWDKAFLAAAAGMVIALIVLLVYKKYFKKADVMHKTSAAQATAAIDSTVPASIVKDEKSKIMALFAIFGVVILFWMAFHQNGFTLTFWARDCTQTKLDAELFQKINPFFVVLFTPLLIWIWSLFARRGKEPTTPAKMGIGMLLTAVSFGIMWLGALKLQGMGVGSKVGESWLISTYAVITMGELCLSPMGLAFVSKVAPVRMRGLMMGGWFASTAIGNYLCGYVGSKWDVMSHANFFALLVGTSLLAAAILFAILPILNKALAPSKHVHLPGDVTGHDVTETPEPPEEDEEIIKQ